MQNNHSNGSCASVARGFIVLCAVLAMGLGLMASPAAAPFVTNAGVDTVSVIDTATNTVVATVAVGAEPEAVAVTPDGTHVYVTNIFSPPVSVIDTATNTVVAAVPVAGVWVAVTPDGKHAYVTNTHDGTVSVIDAATNTVVATVPVGGPAMRSPPRRMEDTPMARISTPALSR